MRSIPRDWERWVPDPRRLTADTTRPPVRPVWVRLDTLFPRDDDARGQAVTDGLDLAGTTRGIQLGWKRGSTGEWLAVVNYAIRRADGQGEPTIWNEQLVPAAAVSPREDNHPIAGR